MKRAMRLLWPNFVSSGDYNSSKNKYIIGNQIGSYIRSYLSSGVSKIAITIYIWSLF